jgi:hypothetical protein
MPKGSLPGERRGGRKKGTPNRRTVQKLIEASTQVAEIKKLGQRKATEVMNELMQTARGMVALYQKRIVTADGKDLKPDALPADVEQFWKAMDCAAIFTRNLAPYQDPMLTRVDVSASLLTPGVPLDASDNAGDKAKLVEGKVITIDDPVALGRAYARAVARVA